MVAKISSGASLFGAIKYNQQKVDEGVAEVLSSQNIIRPLDGSYNIPLCMRSFEPYLAANNKTQNPRIHISLNPHPDDILTNEQLDTIAQEYIEKLGYGKQPYLIYKHTDLEREHLHIVSVRVDENGKKISDAFEKKRSADILRELEEKYKLIPAQKSAQGDYALQRVNPKDGNVKKQVATITKELMRSYHFQSIHEYRALLSLYDITVEEAKGEVRGKAYNGLVYSVLNKKGAKVGKPIKASLVSKLVGYDALQKHFQKSKAPLADKQLKEKAKACISKAMSTCRNRNDFEKILEKAKIAVVFRSNDEGRIYGTTFIDHQNKVVFNGSRLGKEFSANTFHELFNGQTNNKHAFDEKVFDNNTYQTPEYEQKQDSNGEAVAGIFSMEQHGEDYEEIAFANRMKRKKKRPRGPKLYHYAQSKQNMDSKTGRFLCRIANHSTCSNNLVSQNIR